MYPEDLNSPCRELSSGGLGIIVTLLVHWQIGFSCASPGKAIQLYLLSNYPCFEQPYLVVHTKAGRIPAQHEWGAQGHIESRKEKESIGEDSNNIERTEVWFDFVVCINNNKIQDCLNSLQS